MSKPTPHFSRLDASLQEYYEACRGHKSNNYNSDNSNSDISSNDTSDRDSPTVWRSTRHSPLRGTARLTLYQQKNNNKNRNNNYNYNNRKELIEIHRGEAAAAAAACLTHPLTLTLNTCNREEENKEKEKVYKNDKNSSNYIISGNIYGELNEDCILLDALCALRQSPNKNFETSISTQGNNNNNNNNNNSSISSGPLVWSLRKRVVSSEFWKNISFSLSTIVEAIIIGANDIARAQWQLRFLALSLSKEDDGIMEDVFTDYSQFCTGEEGLILAGRLVLHRFSAFIQTIIQNIIKWTLQLQEEKGNNSFNAMEKINLQKNIENKLLPLRRCIYLLENACNINFNLNQINNLSLNSNNIDIAACASGFIDYLIIRMSALQDSNTMDLYRFYMILLLHCSWPYVLLITSAIFGFITDIDAHFWRSKIPRIFRLSFSHIRVGENDIKKKTGGILSTDILSLVLLCVGYEKVDLNNYKSEAQRESDRARRRASFTALFSSRSFILRSFITFARQKDLIGWSRKRSVDGGLTQEKEKKKNNNNNLNKGEFWRNSLNEWESGRFLRQKGSTTNCYTAGALPLIISDNYDNNNNNNNNNNDKIENQFASSKLENTSFWALKVEDNKIHHDLLLVNNNNSNNNKSDSSILELWLHTSLPAARWVTASLLVPIAQVVQRLHQRRLTELLSTTALRHRIGNYINNYDDSIIINNNNKLPDIYMEPDMNIVEDEEEGRNGITRAQTIKVNALTFSHQRGQEKFINLNFGSSAIVLASNRLIFRDAVKLIIDIALCRDSEQIIHNFLYQLFQEPHWWYRRDVGEYNYTGTASSFISTAFANAIRGKPLGQFVRLSILPKETIVSTITTTTSEDKSNDYVHDMLRTFASFQLIFSFPWDIELILLPQSLSVEWGSDGSIQEKYALYFWKNRRLGEINNNNNKEDGIVNNEEEQRQQKNTIQKRDSWSYCFGYLCSLHYAQISLREQRKRLQRRDLDTHNIMSVFGTTEKGKNHATRLTRGLGSAYFELSFAVDSLLSFTQNTISVISRELEVELTKVGSASSCITLCQRLDTLILRLCCVCFPIEPQEQQNNNNNNSVAPSIVSNSIRECITAVLTIALDPANLPLKYVTSRTQNAIEALAAVVRALPMNSILKEHLKPLLVLLTFNRFYGE